MAGSWQHPIADPRRTSPHLPTSCGDDLRRLLLVHGKGLLHQHGLAAGDHGQRCVAVRRVDHRHVHDVHLAAARQSKSSRRPSADTMHAGCVQRMAVGGWGKAVTTSFETWQHVQVGSAVRT